MAGHNSLLLALRDELLRAHRAAHTGQSVLSQAVAGTIIGRVQLRAGPPTPNAEALRESGHPWCGRRVARSGRQSSFGVGHWLSRSYPPWPASGFTRAALPLLVRIGHAYRTWAVAGLAGGRCIGEEHTMADVAAPGDGPESCGAIEAAEDPRPPVAANRSLLGAGVRLAVGTEQGIGLARRWHQGASWNRMPRV